MLNWHGAAGDTRRRLAWHLMTSTALICTATGCSRVADKLSGKSQAAPVNYEKQAERPPLKPKNPLHIATTYWAKQHQKNPRDATAGLSYARNLKALGAKDKAMAVLARVYQYNQRNGKIASEYGRLALDAGDEELAEKLLNRAQKAGEGSDWRLLSAQGTLHAKRGDHATAQRYYLTALKAKPDATSVINNLALSYALDKKAGEAETLLKKAVRKGHDTPRIRQNLALVLGLQRKFDEAEQVAKTDLADAKATANVDYLQKMVRETKVARASADRRKGNAGREETGALTTASLPFTRENAPVPANADSAPQGSSRTARAKSGAGRVQIAQAAPLPRKKPDPPARQPGKVKTGGAPQASKPSSAGRPKAQPAQEARPVRTARVAAELTREASWSATVAQTRPAQPGGGKNAGFTFPVMD